MKFEDWLKTETGQRCLSMPIGGQQFLRNRLWWAFMAGAEEGIAAQKEASGATVGEKP